MFVYFRRSFSGHFPLYMDVKIRRSLGCLRNVDFRSPWLLHHRPRFPSQRQTQGRALYRPADVLPPPATTTKRRAQPRCRCPPLASSAALPSSERQPRIMRRRARTELLN